MIRVYLTQEAPMVSKDGCHYFKGLLVHKELVNPYVDLNLEFPGCTKLPDVFLPQHVSKITYRGVFSIQSFRVAGVYRFKTATGVVVASSSTDKGFGLEATDVADMAELYTLMMTGEIYPDTPYDKPQVPPPAIHLRQLLREVWRVIERDVRQWCRRRMN